MLTFDKYEGLGNDFLVVEIEHPSAFKAEWASLLCDRHFGVGGDGVLLVSPASQARARMSVINQDGSRPEMCGNGLRCVALHLARRDGARLVTFEVETDAGTLHCDLRAESNHQAWVRTRIGRATLLGEHLVTHNGSGLSFRLVSTGNPHAVLFEHGLTVAEIDELAPRVSASLPQGANVEFVSRTGEGSFELIVWERGVGRTLACGTGAAAATAAAIETGRAHSDQPVTMCLPGGKLEVVLNAELEIELAGPARHIFSGKVSQFGPV
jgi:diaminopimelate epimerase